MCGIYGLVFHSNKHLEQPYKVREFFNAMAQKAVSRGDDAAGAAVVQKDFALAVYKNALPSTKVVNFRRWRRLFRKVGENTLALMGHTRLGTHGDNIIANAHPFAFDSVIGAHNGVIYNHERFGPVKPFDCDSANVIYRLGEIDSADWPDYLEALDGSFALAFATPGQFHLARNSSSPCELSYVQELDATAYASTMEILAAGHVAIQSAVTKFRELPTGQIWTFHFGSSDETKREFKAMMYRRYSPAPGGSTTSTPEVTDSCDIIQVPFNLLGQGECEVCAEVKEHLIDHHSGPVCMECYEELFMEIDADDEDEVEGCCDMCGRESILSRVGLTDNFLCRWCTAEDQQGSMRSNHISCQNCQVSYPVEQLGEHIIFDDSSEQYICKKCYDWLSDMSPEGWMGLTPRSEYW